MGVTEVIRGSDLLTSTGCQIQLFRALGKTPPRYGHIPLLTNPEGRRLSKRERDLDIGALRARLSPEELLGHLAHLLGMLERPEPLTAKEMIPLCKTADLSRPNVIVPDNFAR